MIFVLATLMMAASAPADADPLFESRIKTLPRDGLATKIEWFDPLASLRASQTPISIARDNVAIANQSERFTKAVDYAAETDSNALLVWRDGVLLVEQYGDGVTVESARTQSNSMHKSVLALVLNIAVQRGDIESLDDPASNYIGDWIDQPHGKITLRHLLTMSSGLELAPPDYNNPYSFGRRLFSASDISSVARSAPQVAAPGEKFEYNNVNPQILVDVIEAATGAKYADYAGEHLWSKFAKYDADVWLDRAGGAAHGYCCLIANAEDWLRLGILIMNGGATGAQKIIDEERVIDIFDASPANPNYGQLVWRGTPYKEIRKYRPNAQFGVPHSQPYLAPDVFFFDGFGGQRVYIIPSRRVVIVRTGAEQFNWDDSILPNAVLATLDDALETKAFSDCDVCPEMIEIPLGDARIGSTTDETARYGVLGRYAKREQPQVRVPIVSRFAMSRYEITNAQFFAFVKDTDRDFSGGCDQFHGNHWAIDDALSWEDPGFQAGDNHPVTCVSADDAMAYAAWLADSTGEPYRLASEVEWEYTARANSNASTYWNGSRADICLFANVGDKQTTVKYGWDKVERSEGQFFTWSGVSCDDGFAETAPVGSFAPNAFGVYDMLGNINEWTADCFTENHEDHPGTHDVRAEGACTLQLLKGHTWSGNDFTARPAFRVRLEPSLRKYNLGIRVVKDLSRPE